MRLIIGVLACVSVTAASLSFAEPPAPSPQASQSAASAPTEAQAASAASTAAAAAKTESDADEKALLGQGYKWEMVRGEKLLCRHEPKLGSRIAQEKRCGTVDQLKAEARNARDLAEKSQRNQTSMPGH